MSICYIMCLHFPFLHINFIFFFLIFNALGWIIRFFFFFVHEYLCISLSVSLCWTVSVLLDECVLVVNSMSLWNIWYTQWRTHVNVCVFCTFVFHAHVFHFINSYENTGILVMAAQQQYYWCKQPYKIIRKIKLRCVDIANRVLKPK